MAGLRKDLGTGVIAILALTLVLGLAYPLAITGISQVLFPGAANGSQAVARRQGRRLATDRPGIQGQGCFHSRPSATEYSGDVTFFGNAAPNSAEGREEVREDLAAYLKLNKPYDKRLTSDGVPVDAVTQSASGVDPRNLRSQRADPGPPGRRRPPAAPAKVEDADRRDHRRPLASACSASPG